MLQGLRDRWEAVWQKLGAGTAPQNVLDKLIEAYSSPGRFYHTLAHIEDCLSIFDQTIYLAAHPEEIELAIWFHDAVYDPRRDDNEQKSAEWAKTVLRQFALDPDVSVRVADAIHTTRHSGEPKSSDSKLIVDVDLSILGREPAVFWRYEENIQKEYAWVPEPLFRQKRTEILSGFLDRPWIYFHRTYQDLFEETARENLKRAIAQLSEGAV